MIQFNNNFENGFRIGVPASATPSPSTKLPLESSPLSIKTGTPGTLANVEENIVEEAHFPPCRLIWHCYLG